MSNEIKISHRRKPEKGFAVLRGHVGKSGKTICVFCPYCDNYHHHGWSRDNPAWAIEHRQAHCGQFLSFYPMGYYIGVERKLPRLG